MNEHKSGVGTDIKINVHMDPIGGYHMKDVDFIATVYSNTTMKEIVIDKSSARAVDDDNYIIIVDTALIGSGRYYLKFCAYIPDADMPSGIRKEVETVDTDITITADRRIIIGR